MQLMSSVHATQILRMTVWILRSWSSSRMLLQYWNHSSLPLCEWIVTSLKYITFLLNWTFSDLLSLLYFASTSLILIVISDELLHML